MHLARKKLGLSCNEYCVADMIDLLATPTSPIPGWCHASRGWMADEMDLSRQSIITIVQKLVVKGVVLENEWHYLQTTPVWKEALADAHKALEDGVKEGVKKLDTLSRKLTPDNGCKESLQDVNNLDSGCKESLQEGCKESLQEGVKNLDTYNKSDNKTLDNKIYNTTSAENAGEAVDNLSENLDATGTPPNPPVPSAPLSSKKIYGDGVLQQQVRDYARSNLNQYPVDMYTEFLSHWTTPVQNSEKPADIGKELWRTKTVFTLAKKLENWYPGYQRDKQNQQRNESSSNNRSVNGAGAGNRTSGTKTGGGKPAKRTATIKPGMFGSLGQSRRDTSDESGRTTIRIDVD